MNTGLWKIEKNLRRLTVSDIKKKLKVFVEKWFVLDFFPYLTCMLTLKLFYDQSVILYFSEIARSSYCGALHLCATPAACRSRRCRTADRATSAACRRRRRRCWSGQRAASWCLPAAWWGGGGIRRQCTVHHTVCDSLRMLVQKRILRKSFQVPTKWASFQIFFLQKVVRFWLIKEIFYVE